MKRFNERKKEMKEKSFIIQESIIQIDETDFY